MRLLIGTRPNIDVAVMEEPALVAHRSVVAGPGLDDEVHGLPLPLVHAHGIAVRRQHLVGHAAHEPHSSRPFESTSTMAISSATRTGWRRLATGFPRINSRAVGCAARAR